MKIQRLVSYLCFAAASAFAGVVPIQATTYTWTGAGFMGDQDSLWSNPFNWLGGAAPSPGEAGVAIVLPNTGAPRNTTNDIVGLAVASIQFHGNDYTISGKPAGNALALQGSGPVGFSVPVYANNCRIYGTSPLVLNDAGSIYVAGDTLTISSKMSGAGGFTKGGSGTLLLNPFFANTYSGTTAVSAGQLDLNGFAFALPPAQGSPVVTVPGPLQVSAGNGEATARLLADDQLAPFAPVTVNADGRFFLNTHDTAIGSLSMTGGTVNTGLGDTDTLPGLLSLNGNITNYTGDGGWVNDIRGRLYLGAFHRIFHVENLLDIKADISGSPVLNPGFTLVGGGGLFLTGRTNTYTGPTYVQDGHLILSQWWVQLGATNGGTFVSPGASILLEHARIGHEPLTLNGGGDVPALRFDGTNSWAGPITLNGDCEFDTSTGGGGTNDALTVSGPITGSGSLHKTGTGALHITGAQANTFAGGFKADRGITTFEKSPNVSAMNGPLTLGGSINLGWGAELRVKAPNQIPNSVPVTILGSGHLVIEDGASEALGNIEISGGRLTSVNNALLLTGHLTNRVAQEHSRVFGSLSLNAGTHYFQVDGVQNCEFFAALGGSGAITKTGPGGLWFSKPNSYGGVTIVSEGSLRLVEQGRPGSNAAGTLVQSGASIQLFGSAVTNETLNLEAAALYHPRIDVGSSNLWKGPLVLNGDVKVTCYWAPRLIIDGPISGAGGIIYQGQPSAHADDGILEFAGSAPNTFAGPTVMQAGTLMLRKSGAPAIAGDLVIGSVGSNAPSATVECAAPNQFTLSATPLTDTRMVSVNPVSYLKLNGFGQQIAHLTLREGHVQTGSFGNDGELVVTGDILTEPGANSGGILPGAAFLSGHVRLLTAPGTMHQWTMETNSHLWFTANISEFNYGTISKDGPGALLLLGSNTFNSYLIAQSGAIFAGGDDALGSADRSTIVEAGASLVLENSINAEPLNLSGSGQDGSGALVLSGSNELSGPILLNGDVTILAGEDDFGAFTGLIGGNGGVVKTGAGTIRFAGITANNYGGTTLVAKGKLELAKTNATAIPHALTIADRESADLRLVRWLGPNQLADSSAVTLDDSAIANLNGFADTIGSLTGSGQFSLGLGSLTTGADNSSASFTGVMTGQGGSLTKTGNGTFFLEGNNTYSGSTTVNGGVLMVNGQQSQSAVSLLTGGQLGGIGHVGNLSELNGDVAPGGSPGILVCNNYSTFSPANLLKIEINGPAPGMDHDQLEVHGSVLLMGGSLHLSMGTTGAVSNQYVIVNNDGADPVSGTYTGLPEGSSITNNGAAFVLTYQGGDGNDIVLIQQTLGGGTKLSGAQMLADGTLQLNGTGQPNTSYNIEAAPNLNAPVDWERIGTVTSDAAGLIEFIDAEAANFPMRFYRFVKP